MELLFLRTSEARAAMRSKCIWKTAAAFLWALGVALAVELAASEGSRPLKVAEVHGVRARNGRHLQQTFGSSSSVPLVIDDAPCVSFNADDSSPVLDADGGIVGYATVHSNGYDSDGLSILRLDVATVSLDESLFFGSTSGSPGARNVRAVLTTDLPDGCPATTPAARMFTQGVAVDCNKRRATLDVSVPTALFNCTTATTEDFNIVFFLQLEVDLAPQQCASSTHTYYAGGIYNAIPAGSGCSFIMVTAACKPSTCAVDTSAVAVEALVTAALGSTGRVSSRTAQYGNAAYHGSSLSGLNAAVMGGVMGGLLLTSAIVVAYLLIRRGSSSSNGDSGQKGVAGRPMGRRIRRHHSIASNYMDADNYDDSFTIDTAGGAAGITLRGFNRRGGSSALEKAAVATGGASSTSLSGRMPGLAELTAVGARRWRDKFGVGEGAADSTAAAAASGAEAEASVTVTAGGECGTGSDSRGTGSGDASPRPGAGGGDGNQLMAGALRHASASSSASGLRPPATPLRGSGAGPMNPRLPSVFFSSPRVPSVFAAPTLWSPTRTASAAASPIATAAPTSSTAAQASRPSVTITQFPGAELLSPMPPSSRTEKRYRHHSNARRSLAAFTVPAVPMLLDRAAIGNGGGGGGAFAADAAGLLIHPELAPPCAATNVFLNPLAILRGGRDRGRGRAKSYSWDQHSDEELSTGMSAGTTSASDAAWRVAVQSPTVVRSGSASAGSNRGTAGPVAEGVTSPDGRDPAAAGGNRRAMIAARMTAATATAEAGSTSVGTRESQDQHLQHSRGIRPTHAGNLRSVLPRPPPLVPRASPTSPLGGTSSQGQASAAPSSSSSLSTPLAPAIPVFSRLSQSAVAARAKRTHGSLPQGVSTRGSLGSIQSHVSPQPVKAPSSPSTAPSSGGE